MAELKLRISDFFTRNLGDVLRDRSARDSLTVSYHVGLLFPLSIQ